MSSARPRLAALPAPPAGPQLTWQLAVSTECLLPARACVLGSPLRCPMSAGAAV